MIEGIVLAAGLSRRFGTPKLLCPFRDRPLIWHVLDACAASRLSQVHAVIPHDGGDVEKAIAQWSDSTCARPRRIRVVCAPRSDAMIVSLQAGLRAAGGLGAMIVLADMPLITPGIIDALIDAFDPELGIVMPVCDGVECHPRIIPRDLFEEFLMLDEGARGFQVIERHRARVQLVAVGEQSNFSDVDTPADLPPS